jgi:DnaJ-class molecular chaperone
MPGRQVLAEQVVRNPYEVLGVAPAASAADIQKAYRKLAKQLHPDLNPGDKTAEEKFKEISAAYDLLGDTEKRKRFDDGEIDAAGAERPQRPFYRDFAASDHAHPYTDDSGYADFMESDDGFAELLRRAERARANRRGRDLHYQLPIAFAESITGANKRLTLPDGGTLDVTIPPGLVDGQILRLRGKGAPGAGTGGPGDALIEVEVLPDPRFTREGDDISLELPVSLSEAVLGGRVRVSTPTGEVTMTVPKGSNTGTTLRLKGKGAPHLGGGHGDQFVKLKVVLPRPPDPELEAFVSNWEKGKAFNPRQESAS